MADHRITVTIVPEVETGALKELEALENNVIKVPIEADFDTKSMTADIQKALSGIKSGNLNQKIQLEFDNSSWQRQLNTAESLAKKSATAINNDFSKALRNSGTNTSLRNQLTGKDSVMNMSTVELETFIKNYQEALTKLSATRIDMNNITTGLDEQSLYDYGQALQDVCNYLEVMNSSQMDFSNYGIKNAGDELKTYSNELDNLTKNAANIGNEIGAKNVEAIYSEIQSMYEGVVNAIGAIDGISFDDLSRGLTAGVKDAQAEIQNLLAELDDAKVQIDSLQQRDRSSEYVKDYYQGLANAYSDEAERIQEALNESESKLAEFGKAGFDTSNVSSIAEELAKLTTAKGDIDNISESFQNLQQTMGLIGEATSADGTFNFDAITNKFIELQAQLEKTKADLAVYKDVSYQYQEELDRSVSLETYEEECTKVNKYMEELSSLQQQWSQLSDMGINESNVGQAAEILSQYTAIEGEAENLQQTFTGVKEAASGVEEGVAINTEQFEQLLTLIQQISEALTQLSSFDFQSAFGTIDAEGQFQPYLASIQDMITATQELQTAMSEVNPQVSLKIGGSNPIQQNMQYGESARELVSVYQEAYAALKQLLGGEKELIQLGITGSNAGLSSYGREATVDVKAVKDTSTIVNALDEIGSSSTSLKQQIADYEKLFQVIEKGAEIKGIDLSSWTEQFNQPMEEAQKSLTDVTSGAKQAEETAQQLQNLFGGTNNIDFSGMTKSLEDILDIIGEINNKLGEGLDFGKLFGDDENSLTNLLEPLKQMPEILNDISNQLKDGLGLKDLIPESSSDGIDSLKQSLSEIASTVQGLSGTDAALDGFVSSLQQLSSLDLSGIASDLKGVTELKGLNNVTKSLEKQSSTYQKEQSKALNSAIDDYLKAGGSESNSAVQNARELLTTLDSEFSAMGLAGKSSVEDITSSMEGMSSIIQETISDLSSLTTELNQAPSDKDVMKNLQKQTDTFQKSQTKELNSAIKDYLKAGGNETDVAVQDAREAISMLNTEFANVGSAGKESMDGIVSSMEGMSSVVQETVSNLSNLTTEMQRVESDEQRSQNLEKEYASSLKTMETLQSRLTNSKGKELSVSDTARLETARAQIEEINNMTDEVAQEVVNKFADQLEQINDNFSESIQRLLDIDISNTANTLDNAVEGLGSYDEIKANLLELQELRDKFSQSPDLFTDEDISRAKELGNSVKDLSKDLTQLNTKQGTYQGTLTSTDMSGRINELKSYIKAQNEASNATVEFNKVTKDGSALNYTVTDRNAGTVQEYTATIDEGTGAWRTFMESESEYVSVSDRVIGALQGKMASLTSYIAVMTSFRQVFNTIKEGIQTVEEINSAMTQLEIVTGATQTQLDSFLESSISLSKELGQSVSDVVDSITVFSRLGYNLEDASELAKYTSILSNVADVDIEDATTGLTSAIKGFDLDVSEAEHVSDVLITVGQNYAVSASEILEAFTRSSAAFGATDTTLEEAAAIIAAGNAAVQDASTVGTALKTKNLYCLYVPKCAYGTYLIAGNA